VFASGLLSVQIEDPPEREETSTHDVTCYSEWSTFESEFVIIVIYIFSRVPTLPGKHGNL